MLSDVQEKILINKRKELLNQLKTRDEVINLLLGALEYEHMGMREVYSRVISDKWDLYY